MTELAASDDSGRGAGSTGAHPTRSEPIFLFGLYLAVWTLGNGLIPLLPLRAIGLGLSRGQAGLFLGLLYLSLVVGSLAGARIAARVSSAKRTLIMAAALRLFAFPLMAVHSVWCFGLFGCVCWFLLGVELCVLAIHANLIAEPAHRGRTLAILLCTSPLGAILGGAGMGLIANRGGFEAVIFAASVLPLSSLALTFGITARGLAPLRAGKAQAVRLPEALGVLAVLNFVVNLAALSVRAASPLLMKGHGLSFGAPALVSAIGGVVALPAALLMGPASDRFGRLPILGLGYAAVAVSVLTLVFANTFWGFAVSSIFASLFIYATAGVRTAVIGDIATAEQLPHSVGIYEASAWSGGLAGFAATGFGLQILGSSYLAAIAVLAGCASLFAALGPMGLRGLKTGRF